MKIPNLPTDNLYKFLALFGLVLFVFSSYMLSTTISKIKEFDDDLNLRKDKLEVQSTHKELNASEISKENLEIQKEIKVLNRIVKNFPNFFYFYLFLLIFGIALSIRGFFLWYNRTQKINDEILKEHKNRFINDKMIQIHQIQFDKEFKVYNELWPQLILLKDATEDLRDIKTEFDEEINLKKGNFFISHYSKCRDSFLQNKPFYPIEIFESIEKILDTSIEEGYQWKEGLKSNNNDKNNSKEHLDIILYEIDNVCIKIRDRIGQLKK